MSEDYGYGRDALLAFYRAKFDTLRRTANRHDLVAAMRALADEQQAALKALATRYRIRRADIRDHARNERRSRLAAERQHRLESGPGD